MLIFKGLSGRIMVWFLAVFLFVAFVGWEQLRDINLIHEKVIKLEQINHQSHDLHALEVSIGAEVNVVRNYLITGAASAPQEYQRAHQRLLFILGQIDNDNIDLIKVQHVVDKIFALAEKVFALPFSTGNMEGPILMHEIDAKLSALSQLLSDQHHAMDGVVNQSMQMVSGLHLDMRSDLMLSLILLFALLLGMSVYFYIHMIYPLVMLRQEVSRIGQGDFAPLSPDLGENELGDLSTALNAMGQALMLRDKELEQAKSVAAHQEKMHALGLMTASIAHEVGNPLAATSVLLDLARHKLAKGDVPSVARPLDEAVHELRRTETIITNILDFGRRSSHEEGAVHLAPVIASAVELVRLASHASHVQSIQMVQSIPADIPAAWGNLDMLRQVIVNLLLNAKDACQPVSDGSVETGFSVDVATDVATDAATDAKQFPEVRIEVQSVEQYILVDVVDQGDGIPESMQKDIFSPLFSTKERGKGTGLGLSISRDLMRKMHGDLELLEAGKHGCRFRLSIPLQER